MKYYSRILIVFAALFAFACDTVEGPYIEKSTFDCNYEPGLPVRKILIEDFTGWNCPNCPEAARIIEDIADRYPCHLVSIAVHAGYFAQFEGGPEFTTDIGFELGGDGSLENPGFFNVSFQPIGTMNRKQWNDEFLVQKEQWADLLVGFLEEDVYSNIGIEISNEFDTASNILTSTVKTTTYGEVASKLSLVVYVTESHILAKQVDAGQTIPDYEHNHVLRTGLNGTWGEEISTTGTVASNTVFTNTLSDTLNAEWVPENCKVIAFITNTDTKEVIQIEEQEVVIVE